ncbi:hypothetical protein J437_LFUL002018 [Ladona fulva]|uniref:HTH psq-type domain-containing protein n=1 Tax=Ladona fulva TaxID=123851 RepID=A0A8K0NSI2_LADFU|nr:hypothetical protein J437_LFUL002018 [Ladona fulva]
MASRKHKTLTLEDKVKIIKLINSVHSYNAISKTFGIGKSTVGDIKKNKDSIMKFVSTTESGSKVRKTMKTVDNVALENAVYLWFIQQRRLHVPISGEMICEKALFFHRQMTESDQGFVLLPAKGGWTDLNIVVGSGWAAEADDSLARNEILTDDEIIRTVTAEDDDDDDDTTVNSVKISHSEAVAVLNTSLQWAEEQNFEAHEIMLLRRLRDRAFDLKIRLAAQKKITDFFGH